MSRLAEFIEKRAAKKDPDAYSWWEGQKAPGRVIRETDKGIKKILPSKKYFKGHLKADLKGSAVGAGVGVAPGALAGLLASRKFSGGPAKALVTGLGALGGAYLGTLVGGAAGVYKHQVKYLKDRGVGVRAMGFGKPELSEEAFKKYVLPFRSKKKK
jgi:hypothetical protein